jgi:beta-N-acetylhexosaminidase
MAVHLPPSGWPRRRALTTGLTAAAALAATSACGTAPLPGAADTADARAKSRSWAKRTLRSMSLEDKIGQLFVVYVYGATADTTSSEDTSRNQKLHGVDNGAGLLAKHHLGGIIYFGWSGNLADPEQIATLSNGLQDAALDAGAGVPLLISTDQEQGVVVRVGPPATQFPGNMALGAARSRHYAQDAAAITGAELRAMGINQDFAPVADVNIDPRNPVIGVRSFSSDPDLVAKLTSAQVAGFQSGRDRIAAAAKHFPGHGDTGEDSHTDLPVIRHSRQEWEDLDAPPFRAAVKRGIEAIMTAHIQFPALDESGDPATLSQPILTGLLRDELGFDGIVISDSLSMAGVRKLYTDEEIPVKALQAGNDMLLMPPDLDLAVTAVQDAVSAGDLTEDRLDESVLRILELKHTLGTVDDPHVDPEKLDSVVGTKRHLATARRISEASTTVVKNDDRLLPLSTGLGAVLVTGPGSDTVSTLTESIADLGPAAVGHPLDNDPDAAAVAGAVAKAADADVTVVVTRQTAIYPGQAALVAALREAGPTVVISVREPYDLNQFPEVETYVATYSYAAPALHAAAKVLFGEVAPAGRLPVDIAKADDPDSPLFEYGHGLKY